jgi:hypothetical protein
MKIFRTLTIILLFVTVLINNWKCQNENVQNTEITKEFQQSDYPPDGVFFTVEEYVKITPPDGDPTYQYLTVKSIEHPIDPIGYTYDNFTTPYADRYDANGYHYETQWFKYTLLARGVFTCIPCNCRAHYDIYPNVFSRTHPYCNGDCKPCPLQGNYYCNWGEEDNNQNLTEHTTYSMSVGSDCVVDNKREIDK